MSRANAEPFGERFDALLVKRTLVDETHCPVNGGERAFPGRREGRRLRPAAQARSIPRGLGGSGGWVVFDILAVCGAYRADGPAVDAGRANAGEKATVIGRVAADTNPIPDERNRTPGVLRSETSMNRLSGPQKLRASNGIQEPARAARALPNTVTRYCAIGFSRD